jgi:signal transduction histidine kinase
VKRKEKLSAMGELASGVAHEIRNPLNAISMIAQRYEKEFVPRSGLREYRSLTGVLQKEIKRMNSIVQEFLRFARPAKPQLSDVDARQFVDHVAMLFKGQAAAKDVQFSAVCECDGKLFVDAEQMTQALINLLQNALDVASKGDSIVLDASKSERSVTFRVSDTGTGIAPDHLNRVFDLYFTTKPDGTGMGLAITQQIVTQHGGEIHVESEVGKGSTFSISLPPGQRG